MSQDNCSKACKSPVEHPPIEIYECENCGECFYYHGRGLEGILYGLQLSQKMDSEKLNKIIDIVEHARISPQLWNQLLQELAVFSISRLHIYDLFYLENKDKAIRNVIFLLDKLVESNNLNLYTDIAKGNKPLLE